MIASIICKLILQRWGIKPVTKMIIDLKKDFSYHHKFIKFVKNYIVTTSISVENIPMLSRLTLVAFFNKFSIRVAYAYIQKAKTIADFAFLPPNNLQKKCVNPQDKIICSFLETGETSFLDV